MGEAEIVLVRQAAGGDGDALVALLNAHGSSVRRRLHISPTWQSVLDAADIMQVTYLEAFLRIGQLKTHTSEAFVAWLGRIAENNLLDAVKELERAKRPDPRRRLRRRTADESTVELLQMIGCTTASVGRQAADRETHQLLEAAIARLPETYQKVVRLFDLEDQTAQEVAEAIGRSPGAVYMLRSRAHDRLREILGSESKFFSDSA